MKKQVLIVVVVAIVTMGYAHNALAQAQTPRSPLLYGFSSFVLPGLGQLLQEEPEKAIIHFGIALAIPLTGTLAAIASPFPGIVVAVTGAASLGWAFVSGLDAYWLAMTYNEENGLGDLSQLSTL